MELTQVLNGKTAHELRSIARKLRIKGRANKTKSELVALIVEQDEAFVRRSLNITWWDKYHNHVYGVATLIAAVLGVVFWQFPKEGNSNNVPAVATEKQIARFAIAESTAATLGEFAQIAHVAQLAGNIDDGLVKNIRDTAARLRLPEKQQQLIIEGIQNAHDDLSDICTALEQTWDSRTSHAFLLGFQLQRLVMLAMFVQLSGPRSDVDNAAFDRLSKTDVMYANIARASSVLGASDDAIESVVEASREPGVPNLEDAVHDLWVNVGRYEVQKKGTNGIERK